MSDEMFVNAMINREILNNTKDEIDKDAMYREKAKQFLYQRWSWRRFFMSKKRKERFITVFANTMKMAECCKDNENKIDMPETVNTPVDVLLHLVKNGYIYVPNKETLNEKR